MRDIVPLIPEHIAGAAALFARGYRVLWEAMPLLPGAYADPTILHPLLREIIASGPAVAALQDGRLVGFLGGWLIPSLRGQPVVYIPEWAHAAQPEDAQRIHAELYGSLAVEWVRDGYIDHYITLLAHDQIGLDAWQWLGFGYNTVDAARDLSPASGAGDLAIRRAAPDDAPVIASLWRRLQAHVAGSPIFLADENAYSPEALEPWLGDHEQAMWLAEQEGDAVGWMAFGPASDDACTVIVDSGTTSITGAFTLERARGAGVATALLNHGLVWAQALGKVRCAVDFEAANILATRFWLRHFRPVAYTLHRNINSHV